MRKYFITGIGTEVGKTIAAAIITQALKADYWKPIQSGELDTSDTMKVQSLVSNEKSKFHTEKYRLNEPMSPHASAKKDNITIDINQIDTPKTNNHLIIEGAGGLLVPLNNKDTILNLIKKTKCEVILISKHYLGSINHSLMSIEILKNNNIPIKGILFNGEENKETEDIIVKMTGINVLGRIEIIKNLNRKKIDDIAEKIKHTFL